MKDYFYKYINNSGGLYIKRVLVYISMWSLCKVYLFISVVQCGVGYYYQF